MCRCASRSPLDVLVLYISTGEIETAKEYIKRLSSENPSEWERFNFDLIEADQEIRDIIQVEFPDLLQ